MVDIKKTDILQSTVVAALFPVVIFEYLCAKNVTEFLSVKPIFVIMGLLLFFAASGYLVMRLLFRNTFAAMIFCVILWVGCYLHPLIRDHVFAYIPRIGSHKQWFLLMVVILLTGTSAALFIAKRKWVCKWIPLAIPVLLILWVLNLIPLVQSLMSERSYVDDYTEFDVWIDSEKEDQPNIYWIHADGMLSEQTYATYFEEDQSQYQNMLKQRGFYINEDARLEAHHDTKVAIPCLMNPRGYDTWMEEYIQNYDREKALSSNIRRKLETERKHNELLNTLSRSGYTVHVLSFAGYYYPVEDGAYYELDTEDAEVIQWSDALTDVMEQRSNLYNNLDQISGYLRLVFIKLYDMTQNTGMIEEATSHYAVTQQEQDMWRYPVSSSDNLRLMGALSDVMVNQMESPQAVVIHDCTPHYPFAYGSDGVVGEETMNPLRYQEQHIWAYQMLLNEVDVILERDPNAVIVIQADHGLHGNSEKEFKRAFGEDADKVALWNSTMSAIRVPEQYQDGNLHYAKENPLNIARWLINRFVGDQYEYVD